MIKLKDIVILITIAHILTFVGYKGWRIIQQRHMRECAATWEHTGIPYYYKDPAGCMVELEPGVWVPAAQYRAK